MLYLLSHLRKWLNMINREEEEKTSKCVHDLKVLIKKDGDMPNKEILERNKLLSEIEEINFILNSRKKIKWKIIGWGNCILILIAIFAGGTKFYFDTRNLINQKEKESKFRVNESIISLVKDLSLEGDSQEDRNKREYATLLISSYEKEAIPILIWNLDRADEPEATIEAMRMVNKKVKSNIVIEPLYNAAEKIFIREYGQSNKSIDMDSIKKYMRVLGIFGKEKKKSVEKLLQDAKSNFGNNKLLDKADTLSVIDGYVKQALEELNK
jgi:hypothetical protein